MSGDGPVAGEGATAIEALADRVRALVEAVRVLRDDVDPRWCAQAESLVSEAEAVLAPARHPGPFAQAGHEMAARVEREGFRRRGDVPNDFFPMSPIVGPRNPVAPPVQMWPDAGRVHGEVTFSPTYNGPPGLVHGGVIALVFDELLGSVGVINEVGGFTGTLSVRYRRPTPLGRLVTMEAWVDRVEGRKTFVVGEMRVDGEVTASADGVFISARPPG